MNVSLLMLAGLFAGQAEPPNAVKPVPKPRLATQETRADARALALLQKAGQVFFTDDFESTESLAKYFEVRGKHDGRALVVTDPKLAHTGQGVLQLTAPKHPQEASGAGVSGWFGETPHERVHLRYWLKWAEDYDQVDLNHTGGCLVGVAGGDKWSGMGTAGLKPEGDSHFSTSFETWMDWGKSAAPGYAFLYTYWMDMERDKDGHYWGNMHGPEPEERSVPARGRWYCFELMVQANRPNEFDGELATWIDGRLYMHWKGLRLRSSPAVALRRFGLDIYVHNARRENRVWFDDVALSTGYIGTGAEPARPAGDEHPR